MSLSGSKNKTSQSQVMNQTQDTRLSDRSYGLLTDRMDELRGMEYQALDPNAYKAYEDPYQQEVIDATTADINANRDRAALAQDADLAGAKAFGDKRRGIMDAELTGQYDRTLATTLAGLRSRGFSQAQGVAAGENQSRNQYSAQTQAMINQLLGILGNETTSKVSGTSSSKGKSSGYNLGFGYGG